MSVPSLETVRSFLILAFGFGFVVFWHELGHFLAAKWAGVKVEQFAVGFGQAVVAFRKGLGVRLGSTQKEFKRRIREHLKKAGAIEEAEGDEDEAELTEAQIARGARELGISETEYRLNWIPLGGYVKMLGQDDLKPNSEADDPRAYNRQTIPKRMVIVSAGVIMNVILAAIGFMVLFLIGFHVPPATVGVVVPLSPAQQAKADQPADDGLRVGDRILTVDGRPQRDDWTKVQLYAALAGADEAIPVEVQRGGPNGRVIKLMVRPRKGAGATKEILGLGIEPAFDLKTIGGKEVVAEWKKQRDELVNLVRPDMLTLAPGEQVIAVDGKPLVETDFVAFDRALQDSQGRPVEITVRTADGKEDRRTFQPRFKEPFDSTNDPLNFAGMLPRVQVEQVVEGSPVINDKTKEVNLKPGDVITAVIRGKDKATTHDPSLAEFRRLVNEAGQAKPSQLIDLDVLRGGQPWEVHNLHTADIDPYTQGLKIVPGYEADRAVVAGTRDGSAAARAKVPVGARIVAVAGQPVGGWHDVYRAMLGWLNDHPSPDGIADPAPIPIQYETAAGGDQPLAAQLPVTAAEAKALAGYRFRTPMVTPFDLPRTAVRKEGNPFAAAWQGVVETRDFILQFYVTLRRMVSGEVGVRNMMGPVGIFQAGTSFASKGPDWLIWFLAMISANLAVVNFLPIPIVDGGLFTFLILEKIKGKPLSPKAMAIAQYVGMALLLGIFLFVTYQDIMWFPFRK